MALQILPSSSSTSSNNDTLLPIGGAGLRMMDRTSSIRESSTKSSSRTQQQRHNKKNRKNLFSVFTESSMKRLGGNGAKVGIATVIKSAFMSITNQQHEDAPTSSSSSSSSSSPSASSISSKKERRNVSFYPYVKIRDIPHINDLPQDVIDDCYMSQDDLWSIHEDCRELMYQCGMNSSSKDLRKEGYALRGLDKRTWKYCVKRDEIHDKVQDAVYRLQRIRRLTGKDTTQLMADTCIKLSHPAVISAQIAAISDIFTCYQDTWIQRNIPTIESVPVHGKVTLG